MTSISCAICRSPSPAVTASSGNIQVLLLANNVSSAVLSPVTILQDTISLTAIFSRASKAVSVSSEWQSSLKILSYPPVSLQVLVSSLIFTSECPHNRAVQNTAVINIAHNSLCVHYMQSEKAGIWACYGIEASNMPMSWFMVPVCWTDSKRNLLSWWALLLKFALSM